MNKNETIKKINTFGKIGKIISIIAIVFFSLAIVLTLIGIVAIEALPHNFITLKMNGGVETLIDTAALSPAATQAEIDSIVDIINSDVEAGINLGAASIELKKAYSEGSVIHAFSDASSKEFGLMALTPILIGVIVMLLFTIATFVFAMRLCASFEKCETPFAEKVIRDIRFFAYSLIPWALVENLPNAFAGKIFTQDINLIDVNLSVVFVVLIVLALSVVFRYGAMLQQESDETL